MISVIDDTRDYLIVCKPDMSTQDVAIQLGTESQKGLFALLRDERDDQLLFPVHCLDKRDLRSATSLQGTIAVMRSLIFILLFLAVFSGCFSHADTVKNLSPTSHLRTSLQYKPCPYRDISSNKVSCATFKTSAAHGSFDLPVAIVHANAGEQEGKSREALVLIPGGPGEGYQVTEDNVEYWLEWMETAGLSRDLVLFDPRGTGESLPSWKCDDYDKKSVEWAAKNLDILTELKLSHPVLRNCLTEYNNWLKENINVALNPHPGVGVLSSVYQAEDINALLTSLDYDAWHLWGVSYGTRVALLAAKHKKVKSLLLDSPYPLNKGRLSEWPGLLDSAMAKHREIYKTLYSDKGKYADFQTLWNKVTHRLDRSPATFQVRTWNSEEGDTLTLVLNSDRLVSLAYFVLYDTSLWLPFYEGLEFLQADLHLTNGILQKAVQKALAALQPSPTMEEKSDSLTLVLEAFMSSTFDPLFNTMVYFAVECVDNPIEEESVYQAELKKYPGLSRYSQYDWQYNICRDPLFNNRHPVSLEQLTTTELATAKPTVILSGQYDPVTPREWGMELQRQLGQRARFHTVGGAGHAVTVSGVCDASLFEDFMDGKIIDLAKTCGDIQLAWP